MNKYLIKILFLTVFFTLTASLASATDISLSWDPSPSSSVEGYKVYYKTDNAELPFDGTGADQGPSPIDVGDTLATTLTGLDDSATYFFTVTAYDASENESNPANIVSSSSLVPELLAPVDQTNNEPIPVTFRWSTNPDMTYTLYYGTDPDLAVVPAPFKLAIPPAAPQALIALLLCLSLVLLLAKQRPTRKRLGFAAAVFAVGILSACGGGGGGDSSSNDSRTTAQETEIQQPATEADEQPQAPATDEQVPAPAPTQTLFTVDVGTTDYYQAYDVEPGTTYYWKVVATDVVDPSQSFTSATYQFTTEVY